ncbi:uncharacterized protein IL334_005840 [Kwoniella shivajii]|uniref:RED-like N-terminal domain-containing protein n=1 Tax=Kwoniella shivajii TaxID=564305 RepID=A0ABZ1D492_9TREE|nr:hypothetical protein IL334_005840 [Kwoniella shivajii]
MDQDAFRNLLSAPRPATAGSSSRGVLGAPAPKRGWGLKVKEGHEKKKDEKATNPEFAPRKYQKKESIVEESQYKDRAELRRQGKDDEYKSVEKLLEDFEARKATATKPEELEELEKQRAYLGGDAEHSVLVKGLDYALLAARKAELAREQGEEIDDELDALGKGLGGGGYGKKKDLLPKVERQETLGKGFKSIAQKKAEAEAAKGDKKKKKKKKKVKAEPEATAEAVAGPSIETKPSTTEVSMDKPELSHALSTTVRPVSVKAPIPLPEDDDDDDIFGDVGEYDLGVAGVDSDSSEDESMDVDVKREKPVERGRSRTRTRSPVSRKGGYGPRSPGYRHDRPLSKSRSRSRSYDRRRSREYRDHSPVYRRRSRSPSYDRRRSPSPHRGRYRDRSYSRSRSRSPYYSRRRPPSPPRRRYPSRSRSPPRGQYNRLPRSPRRYSPSPSPRRSRSASPVVARRRSPTRSPTPLLNVPIRSPSRSPSISDDEGGQRATKLVPLSSSAIPSLRSFLEADGEASKAEEKRLKKAKWRAQQGLSAQDGASDLLNSDKKDAGEKQKANREYQLLMNRMNKKEGGGDGGGE